jgi:flagellar hook-associated protein 2
MAITAAGVGSGLDIETIVTQLMQLERRPLVALQNQESEYRAELSAYGRLKSAFSSFQSAMDELGNLDKFKIFSASSSDEEAVTASADSAAAAGTFNIEVTRLAQNHKLGSDPFAATDTFGGTAGDELEVTTGGDTLTVDLSTAKNLAQIRDAINDAEENPGVTASLLNVNGQQRLILTAQDSGYENRVVVNEVNSGPNALGLTTANQDTAGNPLADLTHLDAALTVDGYPVTSASNQVADLVDGVDFTLKATGGAQVDIDRDTGAIAESAQNFVDAYNSLAGTLKSLREGDLEGDGTLLSLQGRLRSVLNTAPVGLSTAMRSLSEVGVRTQRDGTLSLDSGDFNAALSTDFAGVAELFAHDDQGYAFRFSALADDLLDVEGLLANRDKTLNARIDRNEDRQLNMEYQLELKEQHMRNRYAALDSLIGNLQSTSNYLISALGS